MSTDSTSSPERPIERRFDRDRPRVPHTAFMRELTMPDGRKVTVDKRHVAFICEATKGENGAKAIIGARSMRSGVPVTEGYHDLVDWWRREITSENGRAPNAQIRNG
jgi:hypothetical protein